MEELKKALVEFLKLCQSGRIFSTQINTIFNAVDISSDPSLNELLEWIKTILAQKVSTLSGFFDRNRPIAEIDWSFEYLYTDPDNSVLKPYLSSIEIIFDIWICEMIRWNNKASPYDFFHIKNRLKNNHETLKAIISGLDPITDSDTINILKDFQRVIDESIQQENSNSDVYWRISDFIRECWRYAEYTLDDKIWIIYDLGYRIKEKPDFDFKEKGKWIFKDLHSDCTIGDSEIDNLFERGEISGILLEKLNETDLSIIFAYFKDVLYLSDKRIKFDKLLGIFKKFYTNKIVKDSLEKKIFNWNKWYFYNYLLSCLSGIVEHKDIQKLQDELAILKRKVDDKTYFTFYKETFLLFTLANSKIDNLENWNFSSWKVTELEKEIEALFEKATSTINNCFVSYLNTNQSNLSPFIIPILDEGKCFSFRKMFSIPNKPNFEEKILFLQWKIVESELKLKMVVTQKRLRDMENQMWRKDYKHIEVLGIFSAFILFTAWTIQVYQYLGSISSAIIFTSCFGSLLMWFIALIKIFSPGTENRWVYAFFGVVCVVLSFIGWIYIKNYPSLNIKMLNKSFTEWFKDELINEMKSNAQFTNEMIKIIESQKKGKE